jgi:hypothetical protein
MLRECLLEHARHDCATGCSLSSDSACVPLLVGRAEGLWLRPDYSFDCVRGERLESIDPRPFW